MNDFTLNDDGRERPEGAPNLAFHQLQELRGYPDIPKTGALSLEQEKTLRHGYYASISYVDAQIGKILNELKRLGLDENTIIVLWGEHGYHLGEQDLWHKHTIFELDARVTLIIKSPRITKTRSISEVVELLDVYPTLIDMCNLKPNTQLSGRTLRPLMVKGKTANWNNLAFNQYFRPYSALGGRIKPTHMGYSVGNEKYRYVGWLESDSDSPAIDELYDLGNSGVETKNIIGSKESEFIEKEMKERVIYYKKGNYDKAYNLSFC